jgi:hypothetical protein
VIEVTGITEASKGKRETSFDDTSVDNSMLQDVNKV